MTQLRFTVLGCGNSSGTPSIGNYWGNCDPAEPKNLRTRPAATIQSATTTILIDTGPDLRQQANKAGIETVDGVLYTHAHADHIHGIDDLRSFRLRAKSLIDIYGNQATMDELQERFAYMFIEKHGIYPQIVEPHAFEDDAYGSPQKIGDIEFIPFIQDHGTCNSIGYRVGDLAYSTDVVDFSQQALETLRGIKTWIVDAAGYKMPKNMVHMTLREVYAMNEIVQAEKVYLTHLSNQMDYQTLRKELPQGFEPAYDGLEILIT